MSVKALCPLLQVFNCQVVLTTSLHSNKVELMPESSGGREDTATDRGK